MTTTGTEATPKTLLDLPAEIRNRIYEYYFNSLKLTLDHQFRPSRHSDQPSLIHVNRQIRHESLPIMYGCRTISLNFHLGRGKEQPEKIDEWRHRFRTQREEARLSKFRHIFMLIGLPSANRGIYPFYMNLDLEEHGRVLTFRTVSRYGLSDASKKSTFQLFDRILLPEVDTPWNGITLSRLVDAILCDIPSKLQCDVDSLSGKLVVTYTQQAYPRGLRVRKREKWGSALYEDSTVIEKEEFIESSQE